MACIIGYKGKDYSFEEFGKLLASGELDARIKDGTLTGDWVSGFPVSESTVSVDTYENVKALDTTDKTNLQKVQSWITSIDEAVDKYGKESLGINLHVAVIKPIIKAVKVLVDAGVTLEQAIKQVAKDFDVEEADITQSFDTISTIKKPTEVTPKKQGSAVMNAYGDVVKQIRSEVKAVENKKGQQLKDAVTSITDRLNESIKSGTDEMFVRQARAILNRLKRTNLDNPTKVQEFNEYLDKVMKDAEYATKIEQAFELKSKIRKETKNAKQLFKQLAKSFNKINPNMVEDIDEYNRIAEDMVRSMIKTRVTSNGNVKFKSEAEIGPIEEYVSNQLEKQSEVYYDKLVSNYELIYGEKPPKDMNVADIKAMNDSVLSESEQEKNDTKVTDEVAEAVQERLDGLKSALTFMEDVPEVVKRAVDIKPELLSRKEAFEVLDAIDSYLVNGTYAGLKKVMSIYKAIDNAENSQFTKRRKALQLLGIKKLGQINARMFSNINIVLERVFKGSTGARQFEKESGFQGVVNGSNKATKQASNKAEEYTKKFKGKDFNKAVNVYERGILGFLMRQTPNIDPQQEFEYRRNMIIESANRLMESEDKKEQRIGNSYKEAIDRMGLDKANSIEDVISSSSEENFQAVKFIQDMWGEIYDDMSEHALAFHNIALSQDYNYTPDVYMTLEEGREDMEKRDKMSELAMSQFTNMPLERGEAGVLMENKKISKLPKVKVLNLDFDVNNFRAYELALTDIYTAESVQQMHSYMKTDAWKKMVNPNDRKIIEKAFSEYQLNKRGKLKINGESIKAVDKIMSFIGTMGTARALVGISQAPLQFVTAIANTVINTGDFFKLFRVLNPKWKTFIDSSGRSIANRGIESLNALESGNYQLKNRLTEHTGWLNKPFDFVTGINQKGMRIFISKPDVAAARAAWAAYYMKSLKRQGIELDLDGEINEQAADYADAMVDRAMDVSDVDKRGYFFKNKNGVVRLLKQVYMPFATFTINMKNRMWADASILVNKLSTQEDKIDSARSLFGAVGETVTFAFMRYMIGRAMLESALMYLGLDDDDNEELVKEFDKRQVEYTVGNAIKDFVSPNPVVDNQVLSFSNWLFDYSNFLEGSESDKKKLMDRIKSEFKDKNGYSFDDYHTDEDQVKLDKKFEREAEKLKLRFFVDSQVNYGVPGIEWEKIKETKDLIKAAVSGEYETEFNGIKTIHKLPKNAQDALIVPAAMKAFTAIFPPREFDQFATKVFKVTKNKYGMTENQNEKYELFKDKNGDVTKDEWKIIKSRVRIDKAKQIKAFLDTQKGRSDYDEIVKKVIDNM